MIENYDIDIYQVQLNKGWWRRKWQVEWPGCAFCQRGYTRSGALWMTCLRLLYPELDRVYVRARIIIRRNFTDREWYQPRYNWSGRSYMGIIK